MRYHIICNKETLFTAESYAEALQWMQENGTELSNLALVREDYFDVKNIPEAERRLQYLDQQFQLILDTATDCQPNLDRIKELLRNGPYGSKLLGADGLLPDIKRQIRHRIERVNSLLSKIEKDKPHE